MIPIHQPNLGPAELAAIAGVFDSRWLGMGDVTWRFEARLREFLGSPEVVAVNNGTSALHLAMESLLPPPARRWSCRPLPSSPRFKPF